MSRTNFTQYDEYPEGMLIYLRNYGPHFNKKLCDFAVSNMTTRQNGREVRLSPYTKENVDKMLNAMGLHIQNAQLYDSTYVANMCKADYLGTSIIDERHLAQFIKDTIDDIDGDDGLVFNRWYADMCYKGIAIDWDEML